MRRMIGFDCAGDRLVGTLDEGASTSGLLIVSGGNEIRAGAYAGQANLAAEFAAKGHPVFRYDRRGVGDSEGSNGGFESSAPDIAAAIAAFRAEAPDLNHIVAFGNCDAASALAMFNAQMINTLVLANPWIIEATAAPDDAPTTPSAAAIRARYWARIKNPRSLIDLFTGKINLKKLAGGLAKAATKEAPTGLATRLAEALASTSIPVSILLARHDTTALAFHGAWNSPAFAVVRAKANIKLSTVDSASHSFADASSRSWLIDQIEAALR